MRSSELPAAARPRDTQRQAVYNWERAYAEKLGLPMFGEVLTLDEIRKAVEIILDQHGIGMIEIKDGRGARRAHANRARMALPRNMRTPFVVLHEAAHTITHTKCGARRIAGHGPEFTAAYVALLDRCIDAVDAKEMKMHGRSQKPRRVRFALQSAAPQFEHRRGTAEVKRIFANAYKRYAQKRKAASAAAAARKRYAEAG